MTFDLPPELLDRFDPTGLLGEGSFGRVLRAVRREDGQAVAVKLLRAEVAQEERVRKRFTREAETASGIRSPRVVRCLEHGDSSGGPYAVYQFVDGRTLEEERLAAGGRLPLEQAMEWTLQLLEGLEVIHRVGVVHRDLKPENLLVGGDGSLVITDFGLARAEDGQDLTATGVIMGTLAYMPPEQMQGGSPEPGWDLYSVGAILFELLTGHVPHDAPEIGELLSRKLTVLNHGVREEGVRAPREVDEFLRELLDPEGAARPASAAEVASRLKDILSRASGVNPILDLAAAKVTAVSGSAPAIQATAPRPPPAPISERAPVPRLALVGVGALVLALAAFWRGSSPDPGPAAPTGTSLMAHQAARRELGTLLRVVESDPQISRVLAMEGDSGSREMQEAWEESWQVYQALLRNHDARELFRRLERIDLEAREVMRLSRLLLIQRVLSESRVPLVRKLPWKDEPPGLEGLTARYVRVCPEPDISGEVEGHLASTRERHRRVLHAGGRRWTRLRDYDLDGMWLQHEGKRVRSPRLHKLSFAGNPYRKPYSENSVFAVTMSDTHPRMYFREKTEAVIDLPRARREPSDLVLAVVVYSWAPSSFGLLELRGDDGEPRTLVSFRPPQPPLRERTDAVRGPKVRSGFYLRVDRAAVPRGLRRLKLRTSGLQPIGQPNHIVGLEQVAVQDAGALPGCLEEGR